MLVFEHEGALFFERRPPTGVWSGLLSFPEVSLQENAVEIARMKFQFDVTPGPAADRITHSFTHFTLTLHPQRLQLPYRPAISSPGPHAWLAPDDALRAGLPAPIRRLVLAL